MIKLNEIQNIADTGIPLSTKFEKLSIGKKKVR